MNPSTSTAIREINATISESGESITAAHQIIAFIDDHQAVTDLEGVDYGDVQAALLDEHLSA